ncbi:predicted protein [Chaetoceros tenuissimus]|uniref:Uncharacterized protein n=1 Tax=Chaetoceros tenuissimus TaxID=426638 RepID=A0AAD3H7Z7_9STRA|nr:predicted protein [Chaetoceros tenuissimus]
MDMNGKQKMTCPSKTSNGFSSMAEQGRTSNGTDAKSSNATADPTRPIDEKSSLKRTISKTIEPENSLQNEEFPEIISVAVSENLFIKPDRCLFFLTCII